MSARKPYTMRDRRRMADQFGRRSDRLHVVHAERSQWDTSVDWMAGFRLVETADPDGLALREQMLADGWALGSKPCPVCYGSGVVAAQPEEAG